MLTLLYESNIFLLESVRQYTKSSTKNIKAAPAEQNTNTNIAGLMCK